MIPLVFIQQTSYLLRMNINNKENTNEITFMNNT